MASKIPLLCRSHSVQGVATIRFDISGGGAAADLTVPEGVYWLDPVYGTSIASTIPSLWGKIGYLVNNHALYKDVVVALPNDSTTGFKRVAFTGVDDATGAQFVNAQFGHANTTVEGRRIAKGIGFDPLRTTDDWDGTARGLAEGVWCPGIGEWGDQQEPKETGSVSGRTDGGLGWGLSVGQALRDAFIRFWALQEVLVWSRGQVQTPGFGSDYSFERHIWDYMTRAEKVRVYADRSAVATYLTAAMTETSLTAAVSSGAGIANGAKIWINGEQVQVLSGGGTATLTVFRPNPELHDAFDPVSADHVATYILDNDGPVSMPAWKTPRRAHNQARYDLDLPLLRG